GGAPGDHTPSRRGAERSRQSASEARAWRACALRVKKSRTSFRAAISRSIASTNPPKSLKNMRPKASSRRRTLSEAYALCEAKAKLPLPTPIALNARTSAKLANWGGPAMLGETRGCLITHQRSRGGDTTPWSDSWCRSASQTAILGSARNRYRRKRSVEARRLALSSGDNFGFKKAAVTRS